MIVIKLINNIVDKSSEINKIIKWHFVIGIAKDVDNSSVTPLLSRERQTISSFY